MHAISTNQNADILHFNDKGHNNPKKHIKCYILDRHNGALIYKPILRN